MVNLDFWYGNTIEQVDEVTVSFYPNAGEYRGNMLIDKKFIGDYVATDSVELEKTFPQLYFNWDRA